MDLKSFIEDRLKLTQVQFAELIGEEQSDVSRWVKSGEPPLVVIEKIAQRTGTDFNTLLGYKKPIPKAFELNSTWEKADFTKRSLTDYISSALEKMELPDEQRKSYLDDLYNGVQSRIVKPKITIVGRSDTGKSTLINALLGMDKLPTAWTPTTSIAVYIKHIADKPAYIEEDVWVFANRVGEEDLWNERLLYDEGYCRKWKIGAGRYEILSSFGTRQGENYTKNAGSAVMFLDAPILNTCDIIDLPGYGTDTESDDNITFKVTQRADIIIYLSQANGFMRIEDITYLKSNIRELPIWERSGENKLKPLSNLFVVASQAHTINNGNPDELQKILNTGCSNLLKTLPDEYWSDRKNASGYNADDYGPNELKKRFFAYTTDIPDLCKKFDEEFRIILEALPLVINDRAKQFVSEYIKFHKPNLLHEIEKYEGIVRARDKYILLLKSIEDNELSRVQENDGRKKKIRLDIKRLCSESINEFAQYCSEEINTDALVAQIEVRGVKRKKEDIEQFGSQLSSIIHEKCTIILAEKSENLSELTEGYLSGFSKSIQMTFANCHIRSDFDTGFHFVSTLAKFGVAGGFSAFIAGNAVRAGASLFFAKGLGGGAVALSSAVGGPIGIAVGLLIAGTLGVVEIFGGGWKTKVAKKIVKAFEEDNIVEKYRIGIYEYWEQTGAAFEHAATALDNDWEEYVKNLHETVDGYDVEKIEYKIASLKCVTDFFDNIPL